MFHSMHQQRPAQFSERDGLGRVLWCCSGAGEDRPPDKRAHQAGVVATLHDVGGGMGTCWQQHLPAQKHRARLRLGQPLAAPPPLVAAPSTSRGHAYPLRCAIGAVAAMAKRRDMLSLPGDELRRWVHAHAGPLSHCGVWCLPTAPRSLSLPTTARLPRLGETLGRPGPPSPRGSSSSAPSCIVPPGEPGSRRRSGDDACTR